MRPPPLKKSSLWATCITYLTSQEHDLNTGLIYFGARYYDPDTARFLTQDSYLGIGGTPPSLHRYLYAYSNPLFYIDLYGNASKPTVTGYVDPRTDVVQGWNPTIDTGSQIADDLLAGAVGTYNIIPGVLNLASHALSAHLVIGSAVTGKSMEELDADINAIAVMAGPQLGLAVQSLRGGPGAQKLLRGLQTARKETTVVKAERHALNAERKALQAEKRAVDAAVETSQKNGTKTAKVSSEANPLTSNSPADTSIGANAQNKVSQEVTNGQGQAGGWYCADCPDGSKPSLKPDFIVTDKGTTLPTNKNIDLVDTKKPTNEGGDWLQIHQEHPHEPLNNPHTHFPEKNINKEGKGRTNRRDRETTSADIDRADQELQSGDMRVRKNKKDKGGPL